MSSNLEASLYKENTLQDFKMWSENALKTYLNLRSKSTEGDFETLVCRAFSAYEENIPIDRDVERRERLLLAEYQKKLVVEEEHIPDPLDITNGWLAEQKGSGLRKWPSVYYTNIESYLKILQKTDSLIRRLESEYKEGKSYRYFRCNFVKEIFYNDICEESKYCVLRCRVTPSQSIHNKPYHVWAIIEKDGARPGGRIKSAHCTCVAGLLGGCNHVIAMLFRIEAAVSTGATKPGSTSLLAKWNVPTGTKTTVINGPICDMTFHKHHYRKGNKSTERDVYITNEAYKSFSTDSISTDPRHVRAKLFERLKTLAPNSCFVELLTGTTKRKNIVEQAEDMPLGIKQIAKKFKIDHNKTSEENVQIFTKSINIENTQIKAIEINTRTQSQSTEWYNQREGRLTASNFKKICSRVKTLENNENESSKNIVNSLLCAKPFETFATRHGTATEPHAKTAVVKVLKECGHKNVLFSDVGSIVFKDYPYISASPDLKIECNCCGKGLVEIKCPYTIRDDKPSVLNLQQLENQDGNISLKKNHSHYYQIQGQLGIASFSHCWYFVFTHHGHYIEKILFEQEFFDNIIQSLNLFWYKHFAPALIYENCYDTDSGSPNNKKIQKIYPTHTENNKENTHDINNQSPVDILKKTNDKGKTKKIKQKRQAKKDLYVCSICTKSIADIPNSFDENSVMCDLCNG
ncbi:uncharacterized protein LOC130643085 [Hydractinia symbiolongicarpus]|uniref:uncharacterized protein LOC130643085 n=1 Tax=Hydractinia symbiolongicarpus TaxID=13093 RepID=UPI00254FABD2|nr:uncharacterized protein LOC130643085 [Hydractinia symbiolongicarpus]